MLCSLLAVMAFAGIEDIQWHLGPNMPEHRKGGCWGVIDNKVVSAFGMRYPWGEMATTYVYDPAAEIWSRGPDAPVGQCYVQGTVCNGALYSLGGRIGQVSPRCFRLAKEGERYVWSEIASLREARGWAPGVALGSKLFVFGGSGGTKGPTLNSVETSDTAAPNPKWESAGAVPGKSRGWFGAAAARGKVYLIGGARREADVPTEPLAEVLEFDPSTGGWTPKASLPYRLSGMDCCVYQDRYIIVVGGAAVTADFSDEMKRIYEGVDRYQSYYCPFVLVYDVETDQWKRLASLLPMATNDIRVALSGKTLYALGGVNIEPATSNTTAWLRFGTIVESDK